MENGLPQNTVQALAQTQDGFLWLGTEAGLVRFDGVEFQTFDRDSVPALPGNDIRCLLASDDGVLWVGTNAGLVRWKDGVLTDYTMQDGLPENGILSLERKNGTLLVRTEQGAAEMSGDRFVPANIGGPPRQAELSASGENPGMAIFETQMSNGVEVTGDRRTLRLRATRKAAGGSIVLLVGTQIPGSRIQAVFSDKEGMLWIGTNAGLVRWANGKVDKFPLTDPLATASILTLMEDREGDLWAGTETDGMQVLRDERFRTLDMRQGLSSGRITTVVEDGAGTLWAGTQRDGVVALARDADGSTWHALHTFTVENGLASNVILSLAAARGGDLWIGMPDGLTHIHGSQVDTFTSADGLPDDFIRSLLIDSDGSLWIGTRRGLAHWTFVKNGAAKAGIKTYTREDGLGSDLVGAIARDAKGDLWVATLAGLSRLHGGSIRNFTTADGLSSNVVTALLPRADGTLLIGTQERGWDVWDGQKFSPGMRGRPEQASIHAILDDGLGHIWFATGDGIARCNCNETAGAGATGGLSQWMEFDTADGLRSRETATNSHPSAWRSHDGTLWFATPKGIVEVDPAHFPVNAIPPPVVLEKLEVDDVTQSIHRGNSRLRIAAGHVHFEFDYAGLSFVAPQKVRYRYMLEGFDRSWTEAGTRRAAYYTNIPPGHYTFRVQAANNDGIWNTTGAALSFELKPHFYQTLWFYALLLAALAGLVLVFLKRRLYIAEREFKAVLGERSRIAREIHDTLAQGYVGVSLQLEVLAALLRQSKMDAAGKQLDQTREYVRHGLADARQSIWALRAPDANETTLPVKLRRMAEAAESGGLMSRFSLFGAYRPLPSETESEMVRVAQEAIQNVKKHAAARQLWVQLEYGPEMVTLEVKDDGRGGASEHTKGTSAGHFGLTGMKERAEAIGGTLDVMSARGEGTTIRLCVPARGELRQQIGEQE